jgi:hypothetical protein
MFAYIRPVVQITMDTSKKNPSKELQSVKSIVHDMMTQLTEATKLSAEQRMKLLEMETQLQLLREKLECLEEASSARSNGAAAPKVVQVHQHTATSPLPDVYPVQVVQVYQHTETSPLPDVYPKQVLQAAAYVVPLVATQNNDEVRDDDNSLNPPKKEINNAWLNFCKQLRNDSTHTKFSATLPFAKKSKYAAAVWATMTKEERMAYKIKDTARWPPLPAPCADNLAKALEDGTPAEKAPENQHKRRQIIDDTSSDEDMLGKNDDDDFKIADWTLRSLCKHFQQAWGEVFVEEDLNAESLWYIGQLFTCRDVFDGYNTTKTDIMKPRSSARR